jgi:hypothetical protein
VSTKSGRVFAILASAPLVRLLLDALQIKSGNTTEIHYHFGRNRDLLVYVELLFVIAFWARDVGWHHSGRLRKRIEPVFRYGSRH